MELLGFFCISYQQVSIIILNFMLSPFDNCVQLFVYWQPKLSDSNASFRFLPSRLLQLTVVWCVWRPHSEVTVNPEHRPHGSLPSPDDVITSRMWYASCTGFLSGDESTTGSYVWCISRWLVWRRHGVNLVGRQQRPPPPPISRRQHMYRPTYT